MWGVALSGGGLHGLAHLGLLAAWEEAGLRPGAWAGTSAGALVAGLGAFGYEASWLTGVARRVVRHPWRWVVPNGVGAVLEVLAWITRGKLGRRGALDGLLATPGLSRLLARLTGRQPMSAAADPWAVTAFDVRRGERVVLAYAPGSKASAVDAGRVPAWLAMRASMAFPGVFTPVPLGPWLLVDGGVADVVPVDLLPLLGVRCGVAVAVDPPLPEERGSPGMLGILSRVESYLLWRCAGTWGAPEIPVFPVTVQLADLSPWRPESGLVALERGWELGRSLAPQIREFLADHGAPPRSARVPGAGRGRVPVTGGRSGGSTGGTGAGPRTQASGGGASGAGRWHRVGVR